MHVEKIRLTNYSSFVDTDWIELSPRLNVVIGQNNSGKSAFLAAVGPALPNRPHRDETRYLPGDIKPASAFLDIKTTTAEFRSRLAETGLAVRTVASGASVADHNTIKNLIAGESELTLRVQCQGGQGLTFREPTFHEVLQHDASSLVQVRMLNGQLEVAGAGGGRDDTMAHVFSTGDQPSFFHFIAQRLNIATYQFHSEKRLASNAANLPAVLAYLLGNHPAIFEEIEARVREIIPGVSAITISPEDNNFKIVLWPRGKSRIRELAFDLDHSGTGVAQAIAIMTAVITSGPSVISIDEINSYLHPTAVKQLLQICATFYPQHQYIVSTHSADVMSFHDVDRMFLVEKEGFVSTIRRVDRSNLGEIRIAFRHLGISMTDVLGADRLVWVEGPTEELAFAQLVHRVGMPVPEGLTFAAVAATGDFTRRGSSKKAVIGLYAAATAAAAPLVEGASFILDRETLSDDAVSQVLRQTDGKLKLLPRRCLECYAINPNAIANVINGELGEESISSVDVEREIGNLAPDHRYGGVSKWKGDLRSEEWLIKVDGARLLADIFEGLSGARVAFQKTTHTPRILADVPIEDLKQLTKLIEKAVRATGG